MKYLIKNPALLLAIAGLITLYACDTNDALKPFIKIGAITIEKTEVNCCMLGSGNLGTRFSYTIPYETSGGIQITKVEYTSTWSDGDKTSGDYSTDTIDGVLNGHTTIRFGSTNWVESSYTLVSSSGLKSNPSVIRFNRPDGAN